MAKQPNGRKNRSGLTCNACLLLHAVETESCTSKTTRDTILDEDTDGLGVLACVELVELRLAYEPGLEIDDQRPPQDAVQSCLGDEQL